MNSRRKARDWTHVISRFLFLGIPALCFLLFLHTGKPADAQSASLAPNIPFVQAPLSRLRSSHRKVFAHYFTQFPISIDNQTADRDYYATQYLTPGGESGKHSAYGGFLRERPLPRLQRPEENWKHQDMQEEVRRASALGLDGFALDILTTSGYHWDRDLDLMAAAQEVDPEFKILLEPDMTVQFQGSPQLFVPAMETLARSPAAYRLADGRVVLAPFNAQSQTPQWWQATLEKMRRDGVPVAFLPIFQGWNRFANDYAPLSIGFSDWGPRDPIDSEKLQRAAAQAHQSVGLWMAPVSPQDMRPKNRFFWEAHNSLNYRTMWRSAIAGGADWVQLITWNDYSESTEIAPSSGIGYSFYDLTAYYVQWFKTGTPPPITRDVLYYFHRIQASTLQPDLGRQDRPFRITGAQPAVDEVELLAFLKKPGVLEIDLGGHVYRESVPAGLQSFRVPLAPGRPVFRLLRRSKPVLEMKSAWEIKDSAVYQDLLYRGGSSAR